MFNRKLFRALHMPYPRDLVWSAVVDTLHAMEAAGVTWLPTNVLYPIRGTCYAWNEV